LENLQSEDGQDETGDTSNGSLESTSGTISRLIGTAALRVRRTALTGGLGRGRTALAAGAATRGGTTAALGRGSLRGTSRGLGRGSRGAKGGSRGVVVLVGALLEAGGVGAGVGGRAVSLITIGGALASGLGVDAAGMRDVLALGGAVGPVVVVGALGQALLDRRHRDGGRLGARRGADRDDSQGGGEGGGELHVDEGSWVLEEASGW